MKLLTSPPLFIFHIIIILAKHIILPTKILCSVAVIIIRYDLYNSILIDSTLKQ